MLDQKFVTQTEISGFDTSLGVEDSRKILRLPSIELHNSVFGLTKKENRIRVIEKTEPQQPSTFFRVGLRTYPKQEIYKNN